MSICAGMSIVETAAILYDTHLTADPNINT